MIRRPIMTWHHCLREGILWCAQCLSPMSKSAGTMCSGYWYWIANHPAFLYGRGLAQQSLRRSGTFIDLRVYFIVLNGEVDGEGGKGFKGFFRVSISSVLTVICAWKWSIILSNPLSRDLEPSWQNKNNRSAPTENYEKCFYCHMFELSTRAPTLAWWLTLAPHCVTCEGLLILLENM